MTPDRPDPDTLLQQVAADAARAQQGKLMIFFGYAAGVGKTYAMLQAAKRALTAGREVVVGYVEPHGRMETEALLTGMEQLPTRQEQYQGVTLREFDVDAALARHPEIILVDELAHTNTAGSRHTKRWQDIEELLAAGINVWTTLNVQHIESLNDVIGQVTGVIVRETIPDQVFDRADELELIDITPEELADRLQAGKVYLQPQAERAIRGFFQPANLVALRELSLRRAAQRVHVDVESARRRQSATEPWPTTDRLLVCVGPSPTTSRVIRTAKRMATALQAPWIAVSVDVIGARESPRDRAQVAAHFRLAESLGAETITLAGEDVAGTILDFARSRNVSKICIGKTGSPAWRRYLWPSAVDQLLDRSGSIDVYVIHGQEPLGPPPRDLHPPPRTARSGYGTALAIVAVCGMICQVLHRWQMAEANLVMIFLAGVALTAYSCGRGPAILASLAAVLTFDFFFVPPYLTFAVGDAQYFLLFAIMLGIALGISALTAGLRQQIANSRLRELRLTAMYQLGRQLSASSGEAFLAAAASQRITEMLGGEVAIYRAQPSQLPRLVSGEATTIAQHSVSLAAAQWVIDHDQLAGTGTDTLPNAPALFLPLTASQQTLGALAIRVPEMERLQPPDQRRLLESFAHQLALALERDALAIAAAEARVQAEAEQVRSNLLSSVSHDLRTPLATIAGATSSLLRSTPPAETERRQLLDSIFSEATRLNHLLENILRMSRLDSVNTPTDRQWHVLEELVGSALQRTQTELAPRSVSVQLPADLPLIHVDGVLIEQLLVNLLENAARYTPPTASVRIIAHVQAQTLILSIADTGPGLLPGTEEKVFERFYRAESQGDWGRGSGLGLAICRAIAQRHGGTLTARNRTDQPGAEFVLNLPLKQNAPRVNVDEPTSALVTNSGGTSTPAN